MVNQLPACQFKKRATVTLTIRNTKVFIKVAWPSGHETSSISVSILTFGSPLNEACIKRVLKVGELDSDVCEFHAVFLLFRSFERDQWFSFNDQNVSAVG